MTTALLSTDNLSEEKNFPKVKIALATCKNVFGARKIMEGIAKSVGKVGDFRCIKSTVSMYYELSQLRPC